MDAFKLAYLIHMSRDRVFKRAEFVVINNNVNMIRANISCKHTT